MICLSKTLRHALSSKLVHTHVQQPAIQICFASAAISGVVAKLVFVGLVTDVVADRNRPVLHLIFYSCLSTGLP